MCVCARARLVSHRPTWLPTLETKLLSNLLTWRRKNRAKRKKELGRLQGLVRLDSGWSQQSLWVFGGALVGNQAEPGAPWGGRHQNSPPSLLSLLPWVSVVTKGSWWSLREISSEAAGSGMRALMVLLGRRFLVFDKLGSPSPTRSPPLHIRDCDSLGFLRKGREWGI